MLNIPHFNEIRVLGLTILSFVMNMANVIEILVHYFLYLRNIYSKRLVLEKYLHKCVKGK